MEEGDKIPTKQRKPFLNQVYCGEMAIYQKQALVKGRKVPYGFMKLD